MDLGLSGLISAGIGAGAGIANGLMANHAQVAANKQAFKYTEKLNRLADQRAFNNSKALFEFQQSNAVPLQYNAMKRSGINPLLAVGGLSGGSMPSAQGTGATMQPADVSSGYRSATGSIFQALQLYLSSQQMQSQINLNGANADAVRMRAEDDRALKNAQTDVALADAALKSGVVPDWYKSQIKHNTSQILLNQQRRDLIHSQISLNNAREADLLDQQYHRMWSENFDEANKDLLQIPGLLRLRTNVTGVNADDRSLVKRSVDFLRTLNEVHRQQIEEDKKNKKPFSWFGLRKSEEGEK